METPPSDDRTGAPIATIATPTRLLWPRNVALPIAIAAAASLALLNVLTLLDETAHHAVYSLLTAIPAIPTERSVLSRTAESHRLTLELREQSSRQASEIANLSSVNGALKSSAAQRDGVMNALRREQEGLQQKLAKQARDFAELTLANGELERQIGTEKTRSVELARGLQIVKADNATLRSTNLLLQNKFVTGATSVKTFSKKLIERKVKATTRNASSVLGEAVPWAGIAIMVSVTTWDIYDYCQTMKDVNELGKAFGQPATDEGSVCGVRVPSYDEIIKSVGFKAKR